MTTEVIAVSGVVKDYHGLRPLRLERLVVAAGERVALSGLDAAAAEVAVNLLNGAILPDRGEVRMFGRSTAEIAGDTEWFALLDRVGIVTPRAVLLEASSVTQNLALPFTIGIDDLPADIAARAGALAAEVGLPPDSGGMLVQGLPPEHRMRILLGRALAASPDVLLLEHPTAPMAREQVPSFAAVVKAIADARALTLVAITEDAALADGVATAHYRVLGGTGKLVNARGWRRWLAPPRKG
jgi:predicted ABC-type transport system involved in lysophospholipase L1 biosynthesis ATPase subunit